jgi:hypothetical protein
MVLVSVRIKNGHLSFSPNVFQQQPVPTPPLPVPATPAGQNSLLYVSLPQPSFSAICGFLSITRLPFFDVNGRPEIMKFSSTDNNVAEFRVCKHIVKWEPYGTDDTFWFAVVSVLE